MMGIDGKSDPLEMAVRPVRASRPEAPRGVA